MKKNIIKSLLLVAVSMMAAYGCESSIAESQQTAPGNAATPVTIKACFSDAPATRTSYTESGADINAVWDSGDQLLVVFDGHVSTLTLTDGAGTSSATFTGSIAGSPKASSVLTCYVKDVNNTAALTTDGAAALVYDDAAFLAQDGTMAGAAKCNIYNATTTFGDGSNLSVAFVTNTSMLKFSVVAPDEVSAGTAGVTLTYMSGETALARATFTVGTEGENTIYMTVPAGQYTGEQMLVYKSGSVEEARTLSGVKASFTAGQTYSKTVRFAPTDLSTLTSDYTVTGGETLTGTLSTIVKISIAPGATIKLKNASIQGDPYSYHTWAGLTCQGDATIILIGENTVMGFYGDKPGIYIPEGSTLTIRGDGSLTAYSKRSGGAGIGGGEEMSCGNIVIEGGTINAYCGGLKYYGAGIGSGFRGQCGNITITGGTINATGGEMAAGIGSGSQGQCGNITITGGTINATSGLEGAGIGSGYAGTCGTVTITTGVTKVSATKGENAPYSIGKGVESTVNPSTCGTITIGGTVYYNGTDFVNGGDTYLATSPLVYPAS